MLAVFAVAILVKAADVQLIHGTSWRARAARQQTSERVVPAPRGDILDATHRASRAEPRDRCGSRSRPREVTEPREAARGPLQTARRVGRSSRGRRHVHEILDGSRSVPGRRRANAMMLEASIRSVARPLVRRVGRRSGDSRPRRRRQQSGRRTRARARFHSARQPGAATIVRDSHGQGRESPIEPGTAPIKGNSVVLTINADLQEIAERRWPTRVAHGRGGRRHRHSRSAHR